MSEVINTHRVLHRVIKPKTVQVTVWLTADTREQLFQMKADLEKEYSQGQTWDQFISELCDNSDWILTQIVANHRARSVFSQ